MEAEGEALHRRRLEVVSRVLRQLRRCQVTEPALGPDDVVGGVDLYSTPKQGAPCPDWRTAQALSLMTAALRHPSLDGRHRMHLTSECALAARFLGQLMFDRPDCFYVRSPELVLGGVRRRLSDNKLGITPTAVALLAVIDLQESLAALAPTGEVN